MSPVDHSYNVTAAILSSGIIGYLQGEDGSGNGMPELSSDGGIQVANVTSTVENDDWVLIGDAVILTLNIVGSLIILFSMAILEFRGRPSTTRTRLVQALILSDLLLGIVGLIGVTLALHPGGLQAGQACDGLGVTLVAILWSEHLWTMALAIVTFMILILPLHPITMILEKRWWVLWILVWAISFGVSAAGYVAYTVVPSGGICYYPSDKAPLFGPLMQFIPRAFVFLVITCLYAKLFVFLRRPDKIRSPYSNSPSGSFQQRSARIVSAPLRPIGVVSSWFRKAPPADFEKEVVLERQVSRMPVPEDSGSGANTPRPEIDNTQADVPDRPRQAESSRRTRSSATAVADDIPPWEKIELPAFQVDGQRFGGSSANVPTSTSSSALWGNWKGLGGGGTTREARKRPSNASASTHSPPPQSARKFGSGSSIEGFHFSTTRTSPTPGTSPRFNSIPSMFDPLSTEEGSGLGTGWRDARGSVASTAATGPSERFRQFSLTPSEGQGLSPMDGGDRRGSGATAGSGSGGGSGSRRSSGQMSPLSTTREVSPEGAEKAGGEDEVDGVDGRRGLGDPERYGTSRGDNRREDDAEQEEDDNWDLMRMLQQSAPPKHAHDRFAPAQGETVELVEESMASYLNRKTALLMLWFPLGYIALFSVSLVRIIYDFVGRPPVALRAISRWFIFAQGILDAVIYGWVEWHTKRVVRRRVKKGTFSPNSHSLQSGSWPRGLLSRRTNNSQTATAAGAGTQSMSMSMSMSQASGGRRDARGSTTSGRQGVTFGRVEERSILRELDLLEEKEAEFAFTEEGRRGSAGVDSVDTKGTGLSAASGTSGMSGSSGTDRTGGTDATTVDEKVAGDMRMGG